MSDIQITMKDGNVKKFPHQTRPGGSWTNSIRYEGAFAIVKDVWGNETAIPASDIAEVYRSSERGGF